MSLDSGPLQRFPLPTLSVCPSACLCCTISPRSPPIYSCACSTPSVRMLPPPDRVPVQAMTSPPPRRRSISFSLSRNGAGNPQRPSRAAGGGLLLWVPRVLSASSAQRHGTAEVALVDVAACAESRAMAERAGGALPLPHWRATRAELCYAGAGLSLLSQYAAAGDKRRPCA